MAQNVFMEDVGISLPNIEGGPTAIGDLWNCHTSQAVGLNLFGKKLTADHLNVDTIKELRSTLTHCRGASDHQKLFHLSGEVALELTGGLIKVRGSAEYDSDKQTFMSEEELVYHYDYKTFVVKALPNAKEVFDDLVLEKLLKKEADGGIKATHVVLRTLLGAEVFASIRIRESKSDSTEDIKGSFFGKLSYGALSATAKVALETLDSSESCNFEKRIKVDSRPAINSQVSTIADMFKAIESVSKIVEDEKHRAFKNTDENVYGVPLMYYLVPIKHFLDVEVEKLYRKIKDDTMEKIAHVLTTLLDCQKPGILKKLILEREPTLKRFILDDNNPLVQEIDEYEKQIRDIAKTNYSETGEKLRLYKTAQCKQMELLTHVNKVDDEINMVAVLDAVQKFIERGQRELLQIRDEDIKPDHVLRIFSNKNDMEKWYRKENPIKILLRTGKKGVGSKFIPALYDISGDLENIEVGVALANVSDQRNDLSIKIKSSEKSYGDTDVEFIIQTLVLYVNKGEPMTRRLYSIYCLLNGVTLPFKADDIHHIIFILKEIKDIKVAASYFQTREYVLQKDDRLKLLMVLQATDSALESVNKFKYLLPKLMDKPIDWIVGEFGFESSFEYSNGPLLCIFKNENFLGVCFDHLDVILFLNELKEMKFDLLKADEKLMQKSCIHRIKGNFALKVNHIFHRHSSSLATEPTLSPIECFPFNINAKVRYVQILIRNFLNENITGVFGATALMVLHEVPDIKTVLQTQNCFMESTDPSNILYNVDTTRLVSALKNYLNEHDPFLAKVEMAITTLNSIQNSIEKKNEIEAIIQNISDDEQCPAQLNQHLKSLLETSDLDRKLDNVKELLRKYLDGVNGGKYETLALFISLLEYPKNSRDSFICARLIPKLLDNLQLDEVHKGMLKNPISASDYFRVLQVLTRLEDRSSELLFCYDQLESLCSLMDSKGLSQGVMKMANRLNDSQRKWLFMNEKFVFLLQCNATHAELLRNIKVFYCEKHIPPYIPAFLTDIIQKMINEDHIVCPEKIENLDQAVKWFLRINSKNVIPDEFQAVLSTSLIGNIELWKTFDDAGALIYWNKEKELFEETWDIETVKLALEKLIHMMKQNSDIDENISHDFSIPLNQDEQTSETDEFRIDDSTSFNNSQSQQETWMIPLRTYTKRIEIIDFLRIQKILLKPDMKLVPVDNYMKCLLPHIIQRLKMFGIQVIEQENLNKLNDELESTSNAPRRKPKFKSKPNPTNNVDVKDCNADAGDSKFNYLISRIDIISSLYTVSHPMVFQDLLCVLSHFPVSWPLIVPNVNSPVSSKQYTCLAPLYNSTSVKWEVRPGEVLHNQIFSDSFKMVVCVRVGSAGGSSPFGKSTILNQVMANKYLFTSRSGPGSSKGIPYTLRGSVEFTALLNESCSSTLWDSVQHHYVSDCEEVVLLANLHGDALELQETMALLKEMATSYIVFFMPCTDEELEDRCTKVQEILNDTDDIVYVQVNAINQNEDMHQINTTTLTQDETLATLRSALKDAISYGNSRPRLPALNSNNSIKLSPKMFDDESHDLFMNISKLGCEQTKSILKLQKLNPNFEERYTTKVTNIWISDEKLQKVMSQYFKILNLPVDRRLIAFNHLNHELSRLSAKDSVQIRQQLSMLQCQRRRTIDLEGTNSNSADTIRLLHDIRIINDQLDNMNLGMEHFFRETGRIYEAFNGLHMDKKILELPSKYADLLIHGQAVEILDGDISDMCSNWIYSVSHSICDRYPKLRIFTLSIIGLQSSGKSTLLNALFACKFAVSVGRCTKGLFMRLLFLDEELVNELEIDAILLIDTEGLCAPEKLNDPEADRKDRILATFAMSISNLTIINVMGESLRELTDILQIVIVTMARLEKVDIAPDILMVQHIAERDKNKTAKAEDEFCKALEEAVVLTDKEDATIGVRNSNSLQILQQRIKQGNLRQQFRSYKDGASANAPPSREYHEDVVYLYKTILESCRNTKGVDFHDWHVLIRDYWSSISRQDFSLRFKNIKEVNEFIERDKSIAKVKQAIDSAFRKHRETCENQLRHRVTEMSNLPSDSCVNWKIKKEEVLKNMNDDLKLVPFQCDLSSDRCGEAKVAITALLDKLEGKSSQLDTEITINTYIAKTRDFVQKRLSQMAAAMMKKRWSSEIDTTIVKLLKVLKVKKNPSDSDCSNLIEEVWKQLLQTISHELRVESVERSIKNEIKSSYSSWSEIEGTVANWLKGSSFPNLRGMRALDMEWYRGRVLRDETLSDRKCKLLESMLDEIPEIMLREFNTVNFLGGMVNSLKTKINSVLEEFKKSLKFPLDQHFLREVHVYAILKFVRVMKSKEAIWEEHYHPYKILLRNEAQYKEKIKIRLKHGFGYGAEGRIIGKNLLQVIQKLGQKQANRYHTRKVQSISWLTSSENIRLQYFSTLAQEVDRNETVKAIQHFSSPKHSINSWFHKEVNTVPRTQGEEKYKSTIKSEYDRVFQDILDLKDCSSIKSYVTDYIAKVDDVQYNPEEDLNCQNDLQFKMLQGAILDELKDSKDTIQSVKLDDPSKNPEITDLLGCTESCHICGSLCWGQAGHSENTDSTKKHHCCHQPSGLGGTSNKTKRYLLSETCDVYKDSDKIYWYKCRDEAMSWIQTKQHDDFVNWTFTAHNKIEFNDLMKWFFVKLHKEMAEKRGKLPALEEHLQNFGTLHSLDHILNTIKLNI